MENNKVKSGFVSIIGLPNAGKSTFLNAIIRENIAITSKKPQTTRKNLKGIYNDSDSQIIFVDTPGIHDVKNALDNYMDMSIKKSTTGIDLLIAIVDVMTYENDSFDKLNYILINTNVKKILVINKIDVYLTCHEIGGGSNKISNSDFINLPVVGLIKDKFDKKVSFDNVFCVSALKKKSVFDVVGYIKSRLEYGDRYYNEDDLTDEPIKQIVADMIRQECLYKLDKEIPHGVVVIVENMKMSHSKCMNIDATIICEKDSHKGIIIGKNGSMIKNIGTGSRIAIENFIKNKVNLKLNVVVKERWRDEKTLVANFGYDIKSI